MEFAQMLHRLSIFPGTKAIIKWLIKYQTLLRHRDRPSSSVGAEAGPMCGNGNESSHRGHRACANISQYEVLGVEIRTKQINQNLCLFAKPFKVVSGNFIELTSLSNVFNMINIHILLFAIGVQTACGKRQRLVRPCLRCMARRALRSIGLWGGPTSNHVVDSSSN